MYIAPRTNYLQVSLRREKAPSVLNDSLHFSAPLTRVTLPTTLLRRLQQDPPKKCKKFGHDAKILPQE